MDASLPGTVNLVAYRGDTWAQQFRFLFDAIPLDLTGATVASWAENGRSYPLVVELDPVPTTGQLTLKLPASLPPGQFRYDVEVTDAGGEVTTWVRGLLNVYADVTNA